MLEPVQPHPASNSKNNINQAINYGFMEKRGQLVSKALFVIIA